MRKEDLNKKNTFESKQKEGEKLAKRKKAKKIKKIKKIKSKKLKWW